MDERFVRREIWRVLEQITSRLAVVIPRTVAISAIVALTQPGAFGTLVRRQTCALGH
jgi:hypothetical protein